MPKFKDIFNQSHSIVAFFILNIMKNKINQLKRDFLFSDPLLIRVYNKRQDKLLKRLAKDLEFVIYLQASLRDSKGRLVYFYRPAPKSFRVPTRYLKERFIFYLSFKQYD